MYVAVMGVTMLVMTIGLSALMATRIDRRIAGMNAEALAARNAARSMFEVALLRMNRDPNWRSTYQHNVWTLEETSGEVSTRFKLFDEKDGDLDNNSVDQVRLFAKATVGDSVRVYSVILEPELTPNLLDNGGMEAGPLGWTGLGRTGTCTLTPSTAAPFSGSADLFVDDRDNNTAGPNQDVTDKITSGTTYYTEVWIKGTSETNMKLVAIDLDTTDGNVRSSVFASWSGLNWQKVSSLFTPTWTGTLKSAQWHVETAAGTADFMIDGALLIEGTGPPPAQMTSVPGTWQREPAS